MTETNSQKRRGRPRKTQQEPEKAQEAHQSASKPPENASGVLLGVEDIKRLQKALGVDEDGVWSGFPDRGMLTTDRTAVVKNNEPCELNRVLRKRLANDLGFQSNLSRFPLWTAGMDLDGLMNTDMVRYLQKRMNLIPDGQFGVSTADTLAQKLQEGDLF